MCHGLSPSVKPFQWSPKDSDQFELTSRLVKARFPVAIGSDKSWQYGLSISRGRELQHAWLNSNFSMLARKCSQDAFQATVDGTAIHFVLKRAKNKSKRQPALLLLHGWPGSFLEFLPAAEILSRKYDVVIPSLPGFGMSFVLSQTSPNLGSMAKSLIKLMELLEFGSYVVQGGDLGAPLATKICDGDQKHCLGQVR